MPTRRPYVIRELKQIRALASALRQDIVDGVEAIGPCAISELAVLLRRPPHALYYHVRRLVRLGLLTQGPPRGGRGRPAAVLDVPGRPMQLSYRPASRANARAMGRIAATMLRSAQRGFSRAYIPNVARVSGAHRNLWASRATGWLSAKDLQEVNSLLGRLFKLLWHRRGRSDGRELHEFTFVLAPVVHRAARRSR